MPAFARALGLGVGIDRRFGLCVGGGRSLGVGLVGTGGERFRLDRSVGDTVPVPRAIGLAVGLDRAIRLPGGLGLARAELSRGRPVVSMQRLVRGLIRAMGGERDPDRSDPVAARAWMVERQLRSRGVRDERVLAAILRVPREAFVPERLRSVAHADDALPIEAGQTISQPYIVGRMTELLRVRPGDRVLDVGTGSGYQAAILAELGCQVVSIERHAELADSARRRLDGLGYGDRIEVRVGDGSLGDPAGAPRQGILVAAAAPSIPEALREQLDPNGGRLVLPVGSRDRQDLIVVERQGNEWLETNDGPVVFVPLIGAEGFGKR